MRTSSRALSTYASQSRATMVSAVISFFAGCDRKSSIVAAKDANSDCKHKGHVSQSQQAQRDRVTDHVSTPSMIPYRVATLSAAVCTVISVHRCDTERRSSGLFDLVGNTPLIELSSLSKVTGRRILAKAEHLNPTGSVKDRYDATKFDCLQSFKIS